VRAVDDGGAGGLVVVGLRAQLAPVKLEQVCGVVGLLGFGGLGLSGVEWIVGGDQDDQREVGCGKTSALVKIRPHRRAHSGGRSSALAISTLFTTLVLMPLPRPSICVCRL